MLRVLRGDAEDAADAPVPELRLPERCAGRHDVGGVEELDPRVVTDGLVDPARIARQPARVTRRGERNVTCAKTLPDESTRNPATAAGTAKRGPAARDAREQDSGDERSQPEQDADALRRRPRGCDVSRQSGIRPKVSLKSAPVEQALVRQRQQERDRARDRGRASARAAAAARARARRRARAKAPAARSNACTAPRPAARSARRRRRPGRRSRRRRPSSPPGTRARQATGPSRGGRPGRRARSARSPGAARPRRTARRGGRRSSATGPERVVGARDRLVDAERRSRASPASRPRQTT